MALSAVAGGLVAAVIGIPALRVSGELLAVTTHGLRRGDAGARHQPGELRRLRARDYHAARAVRLARPDDRALALRVRPRACGARGAAGDTTSAAARTGRTIAATRDNERRPRPRASARCARRSQPSCCRGCSPVRPEPCTRLPCVVSAPTPTRQPTACCSSPWPSSAGSASLGGTLGGVALIMWLGYAFPRYQLLLTGVGVLLILLLVPGGLGHAAERLRDRFAHAVGRRRGVPLVERLETVDLSGRAPAEVEPVAAEPAAAATADPAAASVGPGHRLGQRQRRRAAHGHRRGVGLRVDAGAVRHRLRRRDQRRPRAARHQRRRQVDAVQGPGRPAPDLEGLGPLRRSGHHGNADRADRPPRPGDDARWQRRLPDPHRRREPRLATWLLRRDPAHARQRCDDMVAMFPVLGDQRSDEQAGNLSGGEQQQLSISMASSPSPSSCLHRRAVARTRPDDRQHARRPGQASSHAEGTTVVVVEQSVNVALLMCRAGGVHGEGPDALPWTDERAARPARHPARRLHRRRDDKPSAASAPSAAHGSTGAASQPGRHPRMSRAEPSRFGGITAVDDVDLVVAAGPHRRGSSATTARARPRCSISSPGSSKPTGAIELDGDDITRWPPHRRAIPARPLVPGGHALPFAHRVRRASAWPSSGTWPTATLSPPPCGCRPCTDSSARPSGAPTRCSPARVCEPYTRPPDGRAVHRHAPPRRAGVPARPGPAVSCSTSPRPASRTARRRRSYRCCAASRADRLLADRDRARHGLAVEAVRRVHRPRTRPGHRPRHARGGARRPACDRVVPGHRRRDRTSVGVPTRTCPVR